ncbi:MAG: hypothetical protein N4A49_14375 [Marinifilaceae bacterium]|jgi:hypothetical protein|nr:hypothetical protein [Marinifilaceae bacterium]
MSKVKFKDIGFKLAVIQELMYNQNLISMPFDIYEFIQAKFNMTEDEAQEYVEDKGYEIIPVAMKYFSDIEIDADMLKNITKLCSDGGDDIYLHIIPFWDGEDDVFDIKTADDISLLPNLKEAVLMFNNDNVRQEFEKNGIITNYV